MIIKQPVRARIHERLRGRRCTRSCAREVGAYNAARTSGENGLVHHSRPCGGLTPSPFDTYRLEHVLEKRREHRRKQAPNTESLGRLPTRDVPDSIRAERHRRQGSSDFTEDGKRMRGLKQESEEALSCAPSRSVFVHFHSYLVFMCRSPCSMLL